jgi:hypothetical protein
VADRHPPTGPTTDEAGVDHPGKEGVRLLTWGDPYLTAWLGAVRGELLKEADYVAAGLAPEINPMRKARREQSGAATSTKLRGAGVYHSSSTRRGPCLTGHSTAAGG